MEPYLVEVGCHYIFDGIYLWHEVTNTNKLRFLFVLAIHKVNWIPVILQRKGGIRSNSIQIIKGGWVNLVNNDVLVLEIILFISDGVHTTLILSPVTDTVHDSTSSPRRPKANAWSTIRWIQTTFTHLLPAHFPRAFIDVIVRDAREVRRRGPRYCDHRQLQRPSRAHFSWAFHAPKQIYRKISRASRKGGKN